jgi:hypothetical protein
MKGLYTKTKKEKKRKEKAAQIFMQRGDRIDG